MKKTLGKALGAVLLGTLGWLGGGQGVHAGEAVKSAAPGAAPARSTAPASAAAHVSPVLTPDVRDTLAWVLAAGDHHDQPFVIVDKRQAQVFAFDARGALLGAAPALLGMATGDQDVPGIGLRPVSQIRPAERITPAGRFATEPGRSLQGDDNIWFDYAAGLAIHRVRPGASQLPREQRLAAGQPGGQRVSLGCVVLTPAFYDAVMQPVFGKQRGVVYVLPETQPVQTLLATLAKPAPGLVAVK